ncbi:MAG TPA: EamA family transporter [Candidatus Didemnitutus sp.]|nr:EamA family transporter [Candidatus Didemnitutus sp.]
MPLALPLRHLLLALLTVFLWGVNFIAIKLALQDLPPLLLCALRFLFVCFPLVFFLPRPAITWKQLLIYGATMFGCQFAFLFLGMRLGMSAGLTAIVLQLQVFVTMGLAAVALRERISHMQIAGVIIAMAGFVVVGLHVGTDVTVAGLIFLLLEACSWGYANFTSRRLGRVIAVALVAWGGLVVPIPMGLASLAFEGPATIAHSLTHVGWPALGGLAYIVYISTLVAYSLWSWLLARHPASVITPFALLVPIVAMISSAMFLGETLPAWKIEAAVLVLLGLAVNVFGPRLLATPAPQRA